MAAGDALARGGRKAQFPPAGGKVTQAEWEAIFNDFDPERYKSQNEAVLPEEQEESSST